MRRLTKIAKKILVVCTFFVPVLLVNSVSAISSEEIFTKVLLNNVNKCYEHALINEIDFGSYTGFDSLMNPGYKQASSSEGASSPTAKESPVFYIPAITDDYNEITEVYGLSGGRVASCYALFYGDSWGAGFDGTMKGLFEIYNKKYDMFNKKAQDVGIDKMNDFMGGLMKYTIKTEEASKTEYCYTVYVKETTLAADPVNLGSVCINGDNYPLENSSGMSIIGGEGGTGYSLNIGWMDGDANPYIQKDSFYAVVTSKNDMCETTINYHPGGPARCQAYVDLGKEKPTAGKIVLDSNNVGEFPSKGGDYRMTWGDMPTIYVDIEERTSSGDGSKNISYEKPGNSARMFIKGLLENSDLGSIEFTDAEKYDLYLQYLKNYYGKKDTPISSNKCQPNRPNPIGYYIFSKGKGWCLANVDEYKISDKNKMTVFSNIVADPEANYRLTIVIDTLPELIDLMAGLDYSDESAFTDIDNSGQSEGGIVVDPDNPDIEEGDVCYTGAGALGWILCPVTSGLTSLGGEAYEWIQENFLQVRSEIFSDEDNGVRTAWDTIRNIANVGFVILLLIVIVSQLTGFGIDNYGIKRILPKLIIGAILMNLSYIICELLIDASNIAGSGLKDLLESMGPKLSESAIAYEASGGQYAAVFGTGIVAVAIGMILSSGGVGAILMVFVALIAVVISILVLLVVLVIRQAGVVVCVIIAPIAVMCYLLPNTEKYFKKWISLMKGLLLVYPLCGLVIGAGNLIGRIFGNLAASSTDFQTGFALSAMVVTAIPYLFIPTLLKSSLAAMGNIGAKISGIGNQLRSGASKGIRNSNAMKNSRERAAERRTRIRAGVDKNGNAKELSRFSKFIRGGNRSMARARAQYLKNQDTRNRENSLMGVGFEAARVAQSKRAEKDETADYMTLINNETRNGEDSDKLYEMFDKYMEEGNKAGAVAVARIAGRRKDTAAGFLSKKITGQSIRKDENGKIIETLSDMAENYNDKMLASVMKEIATGENSGMYRSSAPMGFEFAAQYNREYGKEDATPEAKYSAWRNQNNVDRSLSNYVTNSQELVGMKGSSLKELASLMDSNMMSESEKNRIRDLARATIDNRGTTGIWDTTKAKEIYALAGRPIGDENATGGADSSELNVRAAAAAQNQVQPQPEVINVNSRATDFSGIKDDDLRSIIEDDMINDDSLKLAARAEYNRRVNAANQHTPPMERPQTSPANPPANPPGNQP